MEKKRPLIIDFAGFSGAGKTYVKNQLLQWFSADYDCRNFDGRRITAKGCCRFLLSSPMNLISSAYLVFLYIPRNCWVAYRVLKKWINFQIRLKEAYMLDCDFVLFDEGFFRWLNNIRKRSLRNIPFVSMPGKKYFFYPHLTIFVQADFHLSEQRRFAKGTGRGNVRWKGTERQRTSHLRNTQRDLQSAEELDMIKVLYYNNKGPFDSSLAKKICDLSGRSGENEANKTSYNC